MRIYRKQRTVTIRNVLDVRYIKECMDRHGLTQLDLAREMGAHPAQISRWMKGRHQPTLSTIQRMTEAMERLTGEGGVDD